MSRQAEIIVHTMLISLLGWFLVRWNSVPPGYFSYSLVLWISTALTQILSRVFVAPRLTAKQFVRGGMTFIVILSIGFLASAFLYIEFVREAYDLKQVSYFESIVIQGTVPYLLVGAFFGIVLGLRRHVVKKILYSIATVIAIGGVVFLGKYFTDMRYEGTTP